MNDYCDVSNFSRTGRNKLEKMQCKTYLYTIYDHLRFFVFFPNLDIRCAWTCECGIPHAQTRILVDEIFKNIRRTETIVTVEKLPGMLLVTQSTKRELYF